jgi:serine protease inhibitor
MQVTNLNNMKKLSLILGLALLSACTDKAVPEAENVNVPAAFATKTNHFALDFWRSYEKENGGTYFLSPLSLNVALGMLLNGAEGETKAEIQTMLGFSDADMSTVNAHYAELIQKLPHVDPKVKNTMANSMWHRAGFPVEASYVDDLKRSFGAEIYGEDFSSQATVEKINAWAAKNTENKIQKVIERIEPYQVLFLMNALYFKGDWTTQFDAKNSFKDQFHGVSGAVTKDFMVSKSSYAYAATEQVRVVELPYGNEKYAMLVLLPQEKGSVEEVITSLTADKWNQLLGQLRPQTVQVTLPKFSLETSKTLKSVLQNLGMRKAFTDAAELGGISKATRLFVDFVKQDTYVAMDEKGTEAAAVTSIGVGVTSVSPDSYQVMRCDRPFAFAIVEKTSGTLQFIGKVNE